MKRIIHPANVVENDIVEFVFDDFYGKINTFIPAGTKAKFLEWIKDKDFDYAYASVIPIGIETKGWVWTNPDILAVEELN